MRPQTRSLVILTILIIAGLFLVSCGGSKPAPSPASTATPPPAATVIDAKKLYEVNCVACHGPNRQGVSGLGVALTPTSLAQLSDDEIRNTILKGRSNTAMAGFEGRLSSEEINALLQLIKYSSP